MNSSLKIFLLLLGICIAAGIIFLAIEPKGELVIMFDQHYNSILDQVFPYITFLGDGFWFAPLILLFVFIRYSWAAAFALLGLLQLLLVQGLKRFIVGRMPRPVEYFQGIHEFRPIEGIDIHYFYSFPSGHTATAFGITALLVLILKPGKIKSAAIFTMAMLIGVSRIYLGQHFLEDVIAGSILGTFSALLVWYFINKAETKNPELKFFSSSLGKRFNSRKS